VKIRPGVRHESPTNSRSNLGLFCHPARCASTGRGSQAIAAGEESLHNQNAHVESFHGRLREECLNISWFQNLFDARRKIAAWRTEYNEERPHSSLGYRTPKEFAEQERATSYGKDGDKAALENASAFASGVSHFPTAPTTAAGVEVKQTCRTIS
jgi:Integrase core domain